MEYLEKYPGLFEHALNKNESIILCCKCEVWYSGRAESYLGIGDRFLLIKADRSMIVHQPTGSNPINYMKQDTHYNLTYDGGVLFLNCRNLANKEFLDAKIEQIHFFESYKLEDRSNLQLSGNERDMADMLYNNPSLVEEGFKPLGREEHTKYGFIDLFGYDRNGNLTVVECKRYTGDFKAVSQLKRYVEKIKSSKGIQKVRGILACPRMSTNAKAMLEEYGFKFIAANPPKQKERFNADQKTLHHF